MKKVILAFLVMFLFSGVASGTEDCIDDAVLKELAVVERHYDSRQYGKARKKLDEIKKKYIDDSPDYGMEYSQRVRNAIKSLNGLIDDKIGTYKNYPKFTGRVIEDYHGAYSGYFVVKKRKVEKSFHWDAGIIIVPDSGFDKGDLVTVYYNSGRGLRVDTWAEKVVVHTKHSGRKNYNR